MGSTAERAGRARRLALLAALAYVAALALYLAVVWQQGGSSSVPFPGAVGVLLGALVGSAVLGGLARSRTLRLALLSAGAVAGLTLGALALLDPIGVLLLAGGALALRARVMAGGGAGALARAVASLTGALGGLAILGVIFVPTMVPSIGCQGRSATFSGGWGPFGLSGRSVSATGSVDGRTVVSTVVSGGRTYHVVCRGGHVLTPGRHPDRGPAVSR